VKTQIKVYWSNLNARERWVLGIGVVCCVVYLFFLLVYSPLATAVRRKYQALLEKQNTLVWMQDVAQHHQLKKAPQTLTSSKLLTLLAEQLNTSSLKPFPYQLQQTGMNNIQLDFDLVPYNAFLGWLRSVSETYLISIQQLNVERTNTPGVVKLRLLLATK
jgi:general secretion pathway protein M